MTTTSVNSPFHNPFHKITFMSSMIILCAIGFFASDIYLPSLPIIAKYFHADAMQVQLTVSVFLLCMGLFQIVVGTLSDWFGRIPVLSVFLCIFILSSFGCYYATNLTYLIVFRALEGAAAACGFSVGQALVTDVFGSQNSTKPLAFLLPLVAFSPAVAPILGGFLEQWFSWRAVFLFLAGYGFFALGLLWSPIVPAVRGTVNKHKSRLSACAETLTVFRGLLCDKYFIGFALFMMSSNAGYFAFLTVSPYLLAQSGYGPVAVGYLFCFSSFPYMFASVLGHALSKKFSSLQIILIGILINVCGVFVMLCMASLQGSYLYRLMIPIFVLSIGNGLIMPFSSALAIVRYPHQAGLVSGILATLQLMAASAGAAVMGVFSNGPHHGLLPLVILDAAHTGFILCYFLLINQRVSKKIQLPIRDKIEADNTLGG